MKKNDFEEFSPRNGRAEGGDRRRGGCSVDVVQQAGGREGILAFTHDVAGGIHDNSYLVLDHSRCRVILVVVYLTGQHRCTVCECLALVCDLLNTAAYQYPNTPIKFNALRDLDDCGIYVRHFPD